ncbi:hypothetical protein JL722_3149 [Aureococcus anophagefferens]|nr:hypothetical protein JL722_3149 [Aureococcus anophagefferens]
MVNTPRQKAYAMGGKRHSHDHEGIGVQQSSVGALIGKSDAAMKKRLGISDADEARRTVETLAACGGVSALAAACGSSVGDFGSGLWTGDDFPGGAAPAPALGALVNGAMPPAFLDCFRVEGGAVSREAWVDGHVDHCRASAASRTRPATTTSCSRPRGTRRRRRRRAVVKGPAGTSSPRRSAPRCPPRRGPAARRAVRDAKAARDGLEPRGAAAHVAAGAPPHTSLKRNVVLFSAVPGASVKDALAPPDDASGRAPPRPRARALAVDVEVTLDAMRLALTQGTVESGLAVLAALAALAHARARARRLPRPPAAFAGRSRPPDASLRVLFDALSAAPPGAHLSDARVVAPAASRTRSADKRPAPLALATPRSRPSAGRRASARSWRTTRRRSTPGPRAGAARAKSRGPLPRVARARRRSTRARRGGAFLDACADLSYCCGDGPDGDAKYALRLGPPCGAATAAPAPRRRLAVCVTGRDGERSIAYVDDDGDADFPDEPWTEARLFQALGARGARLAGPGEATQAAAAARAAGAAGASKAEGKLARHPELYHSGASSSVHIGDDGGPAAEGVATREKRKVWRKPAPAAARTRDFSGVSLKHGPDLSLSSLTHDPVSPRLRPAAQTAHTGLHTSSWSIGDGGC